MGIKLNRKKPRNLLLTIIYRLAKITPLKPETKLKIALNLEWIFNRLSQEYSFKYFDYSNHPVRKSTIAFLQKVLKPEFTVFDLGCNFGELTYSISTIVAKVTGIDYNKYWIEKAKATFGSAGNIEFYHGEAYEYLSQHPVKYDVLILSHILEHLDEPDVFLSKFSPFFKYIYIELPDFDNGYLNQYRQQLNLSLIYTDLDHVSEFDREELQSLLSKCNIEIICSEYRHGLHRLWCKT